MSKVERWFILELDLSRLRTTLSTADRCEYTSADVRQWLVDAGFRPMGDGWLVREADVGQVEPDEVTSISEACPPAL